MTKYIPLVLSDFICQNIGIINPGMGLERRSPPAGKRGPRKEFSSDSYQRSSQRTFRIHLLLMAES